MSDRLIDFQQQQQKVYLSKGTGDWAIVLYVPRKSIYHKINDYYYYEISPIFLVVVVVVKNYMHTPNDKYEEHFLHHFLLRLSISRILLYSIVCNIYARLSYTSNSANNQTRKMNVLYIFSLRICCMAMAICGAYKRRN